MDTTARVDLSILVPVYNEEENLPELYAKIVEAAASLGRSWEIIFVDDGSRDGSFPVLKKIQAGDPRVRVIRFRKNFGQTAAMTAGFDHAHGEIIVTLDADLQNDPADIPRLLEKIDQGYDIASGWRKNRKDGFLSRRLPSILANALISRITGVKLRDYGCTLKAFRREVIKGINLYGELHRFIPAIASHMGVDIAEVPVNHRPRRRGKSKYNIFRTPRVMLDLMTVKFMLSYGTKPLQIFGLLGFASGTAGALIGLYLSYERLVLLRSIANRPLLLLSILLVVIGAQFITLGLLAEIMVRAYHESSAKRIYHVKEILEDATDDAATPELATGTKAELKRPASGDESVALWSEPDGTSEARPSDKAQTSATSSTAGIESTKPVSALTKAGPTKTDAGAAAESSPEAAKAQPGNAVETGSAHVQPAISPEAESAGAQAAAETGPGAKESRGADGRPSIPNVRRTGA